MTATTYGRIERGQHTQTRKLQDIADVFEVPIEQVLLPAGFGGEAFAPATMLASLQQQMTGLQRKIADLEARPFTLEQAFEDEVKRQEARDARADTKRRQRTQQRRTLKKQSKG